MAVWVEKSSKQKEIDEYFSSINCMSRRIVNDINDLRRKCGSSWDEMSIQEQEKKINQFMVPAEIKKHYPLPDTKDYSYIYPSLRIDTGQKIVEVMTEQCESPTSWFDEFSVPFSWETKSQMDLRLPPSDGSKVHRKLSSQKSTKSEKDAKISESTKIQEDSRSDQKLSRKEKDAEKPRKKSTKSNKSKSSNSNGNQKNHIAVEDINFNFSNSEAEFLSLTSDLSNSKEAQSDLRDSNKFDEDIVSEILPSSELSKAYDESEFLDLYPQKPVSKPTTHEVTTKRNSSKVKKLEKKPSKELQDTSAAPSVLRQKKTHRKKQSSGNQQVNPRSSLTLDGAILNLEIAAEINKQGVDSQKPQEKSEKVFNNEEDLLRQIEKETDMDDWFATETASTDGQKTGFDFLDNW